jgi:hypothetical protein
MPRIARFIVKEEEAVYYVMSCKKRGDERADVVSELIYK